MDELSNEYLNELIGELFNKLIKKPILKIEHNKIYYKIGNREIILEIFKRVTKSINLTKLYDLDNMSYNSPFFNWEVLSSDSELLDFYIEINNKQYFVPRFDLEVYARNCKILNNKIKTYEIELFKSLIRG